MQFESLVKDLTVTKHLISLTQVDHQLIDISLLASLQSFEKSLRIKYYDSYRYIFKIKFSVLIDKFFQEEKITEEEYKLLKELKNFRNHQLHLPDENPFVIEDKKNKALMVYNITLKLWDEINI
jgi:hypothetical protein